MSTATDVVARFYRAAQAGDGLAIAALLHPNFHGRAAPGLPCGAGGAVHSPQEALTRLWGPIFAAFDTAPYDETWHETTDGLVVVTGHYRGTARVTGRGYQAEFAHLWWVDDGRLAWLHQYTDTMCWHEPLVESDE